MGRTINREEAKLLLGQRDLTTLPILERDNELFCMSVEDWSGNPLWKALPAELRVEIEAGEISSSENSRFDQALCISLAENYRGATNGYLLAEVFKIHPEITAVEGSAPNLESCPCCGRRSLCERASYDICTVCWWEDDGQDDKDADKVAGGPNADISLAAARLNFLDYGIFDPRRTDLASKRKPAEMFVRGRFFQRNADGDVVEVSRDMG